MPSRSTRVGAELHAAARATVAEQGRSAAQQIDHWVRLGRQLEASPAVTVAELDRLLAGGLRYDKLSPAAREVLDPALVRRLAARPSA